MYSLYLQDNTKIGRDIEDWEIQEETGAIILHTGNFLVHPDNPSKAYKIVGFEHTEIGTDETGLLMISDLIKIIVE